MGICLNAPAIEGILLPKMDTDQNVAKFQSLVQATYLLRRSDNPEARLVVLNHGFNSNNEVMWKRLINHLPSDCHVLAANAPYPMPTRDGESWKMGYSWFFYNNITDTFFVGYDVPTDYMKNLCQHLGFANNRKTLIGFSQGGYASPHMAEALQNVDHVIGIGCRFRIKNPQWPDGLKIEAVHGENDNTVELAGAEESFKALPDRNRGRFETFAGVGHRPSPEMLEKVGLWIKDH